MAENIGPQETQTQQCDGDGTLFSRNTPHQTNIEDCEPAPTREDFGLPNGKDISLWSYLYTELTRGYYLENDEAKFAEKRQRVYTFMKIPRELEKFMTYGFFQCVDAFLYMFTFLPLRFLMAMIKFIVKGCFQTCVASEGKVLEPAEICDLLKGFILLVGVIAMSYIDVSMMYHIIRGQAIIKLYIFFNMLEVADRLFSSFGQDILDSLFWTATEPRGRRREHVGLIPHILLAIGIVFLHAILVLFQATTLNVAFNSHNKALLTIMMSNNFVELKGSVFKKFEKKNLFQMSCSDVRERFHFLVLLAIVCMRNLTEFSWNMEIRKSVFSKFDKDSLKQMAIMEVKERFYLFLIFGIILIRNLDEFNWEEKHFWVLIPDVVMVMASELLVDWVKHAFITKFNEIPAEVYREYTVSIAYDMAAIRQKKAFSDHLDVVSRRMGLIPLPLAVLLIRIVWQSVRINTYTDIALLVLFYFCITSFKVLNSIVLLGMACDYIKESKEQSKTSTTTTATSPKREVATSPTRPTHHRQSSDTTPIKTARTQPSTPNIVADDLLAADEILSRKMNRSQSVSSKLNVTFQELPVMDGSSLMETSLGVVGVGHRSVEGVGREGSLTPKALMSNSTVSLQSVCLNEDFVKDTQVLGKERGGDKGLEDGMEVRKRNVEGEKKTGKEDGKTLAEIDRFSMCSNRII